MYIVNVIVIGPSSQMLFDYHINHIKLNQSTGHQLFGVNMSNVAINHAGKGFASKTKRSMGNHKIAAKQVNSYV